MEVVINLCLFFGTLLVAYVVGRILEKKHYAKIKVLEKMTLERPAMTIKKCELDNDIDKSHLALGSVVVSVDHFKRFLTSFRKIFGGELRSYSSLIERGRREAMIRMKASQPDADRYINCRIETSTISNGKGKAIGCVEVCAYGTAIYFAK
ncbi:MAG TPA: heavy metal-binding domain-containing protein [Dehalococcoidia bacterium]|nr:heavy metal-binding domain-containing protein [Dehalococcoidia bacterium]